MPCHYTGYNWIQQARHIHFMKGVPGMGSWRRSVWVSFRVSSLPWDRRFPNFHLPMFSDVRALLYVSSFFLLLFRFVFCFVFGSCVCVLDIKRVFLPIGVQHDNCPCRLLKKPREILLRGTIVHTLVGPMVYMKTYIFDHFYSQYLVLLTMVPLNSTRKY